MSPVDAMLFDVFGTCVDWRGSVARELRRRGLPAELADAWRGEYQPQLETVRSGEREWTDLDVLHREALERLLTARGLAVADPDELTRVWHRLDPWPDTVEGLTQDVTMVAAHNADLEAAAALGLRTAFVPRPTEDIAPDGDWDVVATDFLDLAERCGA